MSKSNSTEIIAILWLIAAILSTGWLAVAFAVMFVENTIESIYYSYKSHKSAPPLDKEIK